MYHHEKSDCAHQKGKKEIGKVAGTRLKGTLRNYRFNL